MFVVKFGTNSAKENTSLQHDYSGKVHNIYKLLLSFLDHVC